MMKFRFTILFALVLLLSACGGETKKQALPEYPEKTEFELFLEQYPKLELPLEVGPEELENGTFVEPGNPIWSEKYLGIQPDSVMGWVEFENGVVGVIYLEETQRLILQNFKEAEKGKIENSMVLSRNDEIIQSSTLIEEKNRVQSFINYKNRNPITADTTIDTISTDGKIILTKF